MERTELDLKILPSSIHRNLMDMVQRLRTQNTLSQHPNMNDVQRFDSLKQLLGLDTSACGQAKHRLRPARRQTKQRSPGLSHDEAAWFLSLPEKVQKQFFTKEEQVLLRAACEITLLNILDESHWTYGNISKPIQTRTSESGTSVTRNDQEVWKVQDMLREEGLVESSLCSPVHQRHDLELRRQSDGNPSQRRSRSSSLGSRNYSLPLQHVSEADEGDRVNDWLADVVPVAVKESKARFYQDPETRMKIRRYTTSPQAFDEALQFGFPTAETKIGARTGEAREHSYSTSSATSHDVRATSLRSIRTPSLRCMEPGSPESVGGSDVSISTPSSPLPQPSVLLRSAPSTISLRPLERDMTIRMTLTRAGLRSPDEELYGWQYVENKESEARSDPWTLQQLSFSDDVTGQHGAFAKTEKVNKLRKVWRSLNK